MSGQPLHPDFVPKLDAEYVEFHNKHLAQITPSHLIPWDPVSRNAVPIPGSSDLLPVGSTKDVSLSKCKIRIFTPPGKPPARGWPIFVFYHGGGWTYGNIDTENSFSTHMCIAAGCVVVSVDYRLGPEDPYPAAVEDAIESLQWVHDNGLSELGADLSKIAVGGSSSGGNLAAIVALKAPTLSPPVQVVFQLLVVPVIDNTASPSGEPYGSWLENLNTAWLPPHRMLWFRNNYLPNKADWTKWDNSPILAPDDVLAKAPTAWIAVNGLDILRDEGIAFGDKLKKAGVKVNVKIYEKAPHPIMAMDGASQLTSSLNSADWFLNHCTVVLSGALKIGKQLVDDAGEVLKNAFRA